MTRVGITFLVFCSLAARFTGCGPSEIVQQERVGLLVGDKKLWYAREAGTSWEKRPSPGEGRIKSLTTDQTGQGRLLLCQGGLAWMSKDRGVTWDSPIFESDNEQAVVAAFYLKDAEKLLWATNRRLLISKDAGKNWTPATPGLSFNWHPLDILTSIQKPDRMYVITRGDGVYRSDDGGNTWIATNSGLPKGIGAPPVAPIESAVLDPTNPEVVYVAAEAMGIYRTSDGGRTWVRANSGLPDQITHRTSPWVLAIDSFNPQRLLVWASWPVYSERLDSAFFLTEDRAANWRKIAVGTVSRVFSVQFVNAKVGLAVAITTDGNVVLSNQ